MAILTRSHFKDYCLRRLGWPVIEINVDDDQIDDRIDDAPLRIQHESHGEDGRDRRHRPRQHEQHGQNLHPPAFVREKTGEKERQRHLHVDRHDQEHERVHDRPKEDRVLDQLLVAVGMAGEPEPVADRVEDESEEDEPIVIKMIASQMARKNTVQESMQMRSDIEVDQIKLEIARSAKKRRAIE